MKYMMLFLTLIALSGMFSFAQADEECFECHEKLNNVVKHKAAQYSCFLCHTDHDTPTNYPHRVKKPVNEICALCHKEQKMAHIMSNHPKVGKDPLHPETNDWNCVSCHNPHQSKSPHLIRYDYGRKTSPYQGVSCYICHDEDTWKRPNREPPPWNGYGEP